MWSPSHYRHRFLLSDITSGPQQKSWWLFGLYMKCAWCRWYRDFCHPEAFDSQSHYSLYDQTSWPRHPFRYREFNAVVPLECRWCGRADPWSNASYGCGKQMEQHSIPLKRSLNFLPQEMSAFRPRFGYHSCFWGLSWKEGPDHWHRLIQTTHPFEIDSAVLLEISCLY